MSLIDWRSRYPDGPPLIDFGHFHKHLDTPVLHAHGFISGCWSCRRQGAHDGDVLGRIKQPACSDRVSQKLRRHQGDGKLARRLPDCLGVLADCSLSRDDERDSLMDNTGDGATMLADEFLQLLLRHARARERK